VRLPWRGANLAYVGSALYRQLQRLYRLCFSLPIRKGWVRG
jgi:undecaprenyl-diphosphatase